MTDLESLYSSLFHSLPLRPCRRIGPGSIESQAERKCFVNKKPAETPASASIAKPEPQPSIVQPIIDELKGTTQLPKDDEAAPPRGPLHPPQPAELDQDAGGGYNPDGTYPQT